MSTTITAPQGFFQNDSVTPATISDLVSAVAAASGNISQAATSATAAAASATAANTSSVSAAASNTAAGNSATTAASSASAAAGSATTAGTNSTNAASSATAAATSATSASGSATSATASATSASTSATNASNSASAASTSATNAAASATTAANAAATIPAPSVARELAMVRVNGTGTAYETRTPAQVWTDVGVPAVATPIINGTGTVGTATKYAREDHVHPTDTTRAPLAGTTTNDNASAGNVGEYISASVPAASAVSLTTSTPANVTSISLTAGDWDVQGSVFLNPNGSTTIGFLAAWISTTSATLPAAPNSGSDALYAGGAAGLGIGGPTGRIRISLASTTTVYLSCQASFGVSTNAAYGFIGARRVR